MLLIVRDPDLPLTLLSDTTTLRHGTRLSRPIHWIKAALKEFHAFPQGAQFICLRALTIAGEGDKADIAKPMKASGLASSKSPCPIAAMPFAWCMRFGSARHFG